MRTETRLTLRLLLVATVLTATVAQAGEIHWRSGTVQTPFTAPQEAAQTAAALAATRDGSSRVHFVVQLMRPWTPPKSRRCPPGG